MMWLFLQFSNGAIATLRTSGTEPKLKWYSELSGSSREAAKAELSRTVKLLLDHFLEPEKHGLKRPVVA
jgi:phosphomannomutase